MSKPHGLAPVRPVLDVYKLYPRKIQLVTNSKMSFRNYKDKIDEGDTVILYLSNNVHAIDVKPEIKNKKGEMVENVFQTTFGALKVKNLIGVEYGSKVSLFLLHISIYMSAKNSTQYQLDLF